MRARETRDIEALARLLDAAFVIPGTNIRFGFDAILGLAPGAGDAVSALVSIYIIVRAQALGAPAPLLARMGVNVAVDTLVGAVPILGDVFDVTFKANLRNVRLLIEHLERED